jgi:Holliday junction resolvase RusA-like endonuclease
MTWIGGEINAYLQQVGYWTTDDQGNTITQWSKIQQAVDSIITSVNALTTNVDGRFIAVQSAINQSVDQKLQTARTDIDNIYAKGNDVNGLK